MSRARGRPSIRLDRRTARDRDDRVRKDRRDIRPTTTPTPSAITSPVRFMAERSSGPCERRESAVRCIRKRGKLKHAGDRLLLRIRLDLFLHHGDAHCAARRRPPASRCAGARSCSGRSSRRRAGRPRRSISIPPRAATWCATASGNAPRSGWRSVCPSRFRRTRCWPRASRSAALGGRLGRGFFARGLPRAIRRRPQIGEPGRDRARSSRARARRRGRARARAVRRRSSRSCAPRPRRRSGSAFSARRASSRAANCSGATTGSSRRSPTRRIDGRNPW